MNTAVAILVQRDYAGIAAAYRELLEADLQRRSAEATGGSRPEPAREFADGYYHWVMTLLRIEERRAVNPSLLLPPAMADGLLAVGRARAEFAAAHPSCSYCGAPLLAAKDTFCWSCQKSWKEE